MSVTCDADNSIVIDGEEYIHCYIYIYFLFYAHIPYIWHVIYKHEEWKEFPRLTLPTIHTTIKYEKHMRKVSEIFQTNGEVTKS